jgi:hypothetical protein
MLRWKTAVEQNTNRFSIQRSTDGTNWNQVGSVVAAGQSSIERSYIFLDKTASAPNNMYRIVEYDYDGKATISTIVRSSCSSGTEVALYPNPNSGRSTLSITLMHGTNVVIELLDSKGTLIEQRKLILPAGTSSLPLDITNYAKGLYTVNLQYNGEIKTLKMIRN